MGTISFDFLFMSLIST